MRQQPEVNKFCQLRQTFRIIHWTVLSVREDCNKNTVKLSKKGGWGQNFIKTNFFFPIVTLGEDGELFMT